mmetsp:Transcript_30643/g.97846  ORF Transcript_30643/g.97846 Transcript_30643/m.97846 type:complete len:299 (-) Transcript_30643:39-935(-)
MRELGDEGGSQQTHRHALLRRARVDHGAPFPNNCARAARNHAIELDPCMPQRQRRAADQRRKDAARILQNHRIDDNDGLGVLIQPHRPIQRHHERGGETGAFGIGPAPATATASIAGTGCLIATSKRCESHCALQLAVIKKLLSIGLLRPRDCAQYLGLTKLNMRRASRIWQHACLQGHGANLRVCAVVRSSCSWSQGRERLRLAHQLQHPEDLSSVGHGHGGGGAGGNPPQDGGRAGVKNKVRVTMVLNLDIDLDLAGRLSTVFLFSLGFPRVLRARLLVPVCGGRRDGVSGPCGAR